MMNKTINKKKISLVVASYILAGFYFMTVNPENLSLVFILIPFLIIFGLFFLSIGLFLDIFTKSSKKQKRLIAFVSSFIPTLLLVIQSITQLTIRDVILSSLILVIIIWYYKRNS